MRWYLRLASAVLEHGNEDQTSAAPTKG